MKTKPTTLTELEAELNRLKLYEPNLYRHIVGIIRELAKLINKSKRNKMDIVENVISKIKEQLKQVKFDNDYLNDVATVFSRHGYGAARVFAMGEKDESKAILQALDIMEEYNISIEVGTLILSKLNAIVLT